jgi:predicted RNA-binding Zn ribbon-like protein
MTAANPALDPVSPFKFIGGDSAIDFVNTVDWTERGLELDRFASYPRLLEWAEGAHALSSAELDGLGKAALRAPYAADQAVRDAVALRELLERSFSRLVRGKPLADELALLNRTWLARALAAMAITIAPDASLMLGWPAAATTLEAPLWSVAWAAARLLTSAETSRIRRCDGIDCGWFYVDRSRNGLRRWCAMETCGTMMKTRRRAERNAKARGRSGSASRRRE